MPCFRCDLHHVGRAARHLAATCAEPRAVESLRCTAGLAAVARTKSMTRAAPPAPRHATEFFSSTTTHARQSDKQSSSKTHMMVASRVSRACRGPRGFGSERPPECTRWPPQPRSRLPAGRHGGTLSSVHPSRLRSCHRAKKAQTAHSRTSGSLAHDALRQIRTRTLGNRLMHRRHFSLRRNCPKCPTRRFRTTAGRSGCTRRSSAPCPTCCAMPASGVHG